MGKLSERLVDEVGDALGIDTGILHENRFKRAVETAENVLDSLIMKLEEKRKNSPKQESKVWETAIEVLQAEIKG